MATSSAAGVKPEPGIVPNIKYENDVDMASPSAEDVYEDDQGDVDFTNFAHDLYLARLPKYLWKSWESLGDDEEVQIGVLRVEGPLKDPVSVRSILQD